MVTSLEVPLPTGQENKKPDGGKQDDGEKKEEDNREITEGDDREKTEEEEKEARKKIRDEEHKRWLMFYTARMRHIVPGLVLGNVQASFNPDMLRENGIDAIVTLCADRYAKWKSHTRKVVPEHRHKRVQCADSSTQDLLTHMSDTCDFIEQMASPALRSSSTLPKAEEHELSDDSRTARPGAVLVHCVLGISRSPTMIIAYLMRKYGIKREDALAFVMTKQRVKPSANFTRQLEIWEEVGYQVWEDEERTIPKAPYQAFLDDRAALLKKLGLTGDEPLTLLTL
ncbi:putative dual specificity phosphatase Yvh1 [Aspergillus nomiae NRRL 13137]|uniref:protein-tyrosine-phosphatase n=1 Tax=Aspergillus nomiae NRRL (strain ATCC 15546 / NRRL 13137 / CBS 260.88 / M93) TaxID=1509407 RepID=A0A0L1ISZ6_ASPN3|nr:putative dual specificity phosphatase Yvh1 [Aspergillus nomiae NRRL 13137]KNG82701.1 putative dual specificity phosphatase Yvh1 [Aspergillus nomiae NRRL 13137]